MTRPHGAYRRRHAARVRADGVDAACAGPDPPSEERAQAQPDYDSVLCGTGVGNVLDDALVGARGRKALEWIPRGGAHDRSDDAPRERCLCFCIELVCFLTHRQDLSPDDERRGGDQGLVVDRPELLAFPFQGDAAELARLRHRVCRGLLVQLDEAAEHE